MTSSWVMEIGHRAADISDPLTRAGFSSNHLIDGARIISGIEGVILIGAWHATFVEEPRRRLRVAGVSSAVITRLAACFPDFVKRQCHHQQPNHDKIVPSC